MPYQNEHSARIKEPSGYKRYRRENNKFGAGIDAIWGIREKDEKAELQAIRFDVKKFTVAEAKAWLKEHDYKPIKFEPAEEKKDGKQSIEMPLQTRSAALLSETIDEAKRTIEVIWSTGARVMRRNIFAGEKYEEEISLKPEHVDLSRLNAGAPLLNSHRAFELESIIGVVEKAWIDKKGDNYEGRAIVRFSDNEKVQSVWNDVKNRIIQAISVGYSVKKYEVTEREGEIPLYRAIDWEPMELSAVAVGADPGAGFRSDETFYECLLQERKMEEDKKENKPAVENKEQTPAETPPENTEQRKAVETKTTKPDNQKQTKQEIVDQERSRSKEIYSSQEKLGVQRSVADDMVDRGLSLNDARAELIDVAASNDPAAKVTSHVSTGGQDETETRRNAVANALLHRSDSSNELTDAAREWRGYSSMIEISRALLESEGLKTRRLNSMEIAERALHSTSDFPLILAAVTNKTLRKGYDAAPQTFKPFCRQVTIKDFKNKQSIQLSEAPVLEKVNESGEFKHGTMTESKEEFKLESYGRIIGFTRQMLINDDLNAFTRAPQLFGVSAANLESDIVWGIITTNAAMSDGTALFHADHGNYTVGAAPSVTQISTGRKAMRNQKGLDGATIIDVTPKFIAVPVALETAVEKILVQNFFPATTANTVPEFFRSLTPISEPRLDVTSEKVWYLFAEPSRIDTIEYGYLDGQSGVYVETRNGFDIDGMEIKIRHDFGAKAIDHRGMYKNKGEA